MSQEPLVSRSAPYIANASPPTDAWADEAAATGGAGTHQITFAGQAEAPTHIAQALGVDQGAHVIARRRLILLNGRPIEISDTYYPADIADGTPLASDQKIKGGAARWLADHGHTAYKVHEEIAARLPTEAERDTLRLGPRSPVLVLRRTSYNTDGRPFEAAVMVMNADRRVLAYDLSGTA